MEAVEDHVGGNNHALALKIAAKHPGNQPHTNTKGGEGKPFLLSVNTVRMLVTTNTSDNGQV